MNPAIILHNFSTLATILETVAIIMGISLFLGGFFVLKRYGETRTFMSYHMTLAWPGLMMLGGILFLLLPTIIATGLNAFWGTWNPLTYDGTGKGWDAYVPVVIVFVRLIGVGSIMRAIMLFSRAGAQGHQPGSNGRALIHFFSGIMLVHILGTVELLKSIFNLG